MNKLFRSESNKMLAGICGGLSERTEIDPSLLRIGVVVASLLTGVLPILVVYLVAWLIIPKESDLN